MIEQYLAEWLSWLPQDIQGPAAILIIRLVLAVVYMVAGLWLSGWVSGLVRKGLSQVKEFDQTLTPPLSRLTWIVGLILTIFTILTTFGVQTTAILAVLSGAALAIGLAVQGTLSNVASGIMLLLLRPLKNGDFVSAGGADGNVVEINLFRTIIRTLNGAEVSVPNSNIFGDNICNYSSGKVRGMWEKIGIAYDADIDQARQIILDVIAADERWHQDPEPVVFVTGLDDFAVTLTVSTKCSAKEYFAARTSFLEAVKKEFDRQGVGIPFPTRTIHIASGQG